MCVIAALVRSVVGKTIPVPNRKDLYSATGCVTLGNFVQEEWQELRSSATRLLPANRHFC